MPAEKLTPWFDWPVKPVRVGWYDVRRLISPGSYSGVQRMRWDGRHFWAPLGFLWMPFPGDQWRGLAEKPR